MQAGPSQSEHILPFPQNCKPLLPCCCRPLQPPGANITGRVLWGVRALKCITYICLGFFGMWTKILPGLPEAASNRPDFVEDAAKNAETLLSHVKLSGEPCHPTDIVLVRFTRKGFRV